MWAEPSYEELLEPVEGELRRDPIPDADAPCPRCGKRSWLLIEKRAEREEDMTRWRALACASCGGASGWHGAGRMRAGRGDDQGGLRPDWLTLTELLETVEFEVVAPRGEPQVGYGESGGTITSVSLATRELEARSQWRHIPGWDHLLALRDRGYVASDARAAMMRPLRRQMRPNTSAPVRLRRDACARRVVQRDRRDRRRGARSRSHVDDRRPGGLVRRCDGP